MNEENIFVRVYKESLHALKLVFARKLPDLYIFFILVFRKGIDKKVRINKVIFTCPD